MSIDETKNRIYEAEGLLELALLRPEKKEELLKLVKAKLAEAIESLGEDDIKLGEDEIKVVAPSVTVEVADEEPEERVEAAIAETVGDEKTDEEIVVDDEGYQEDEDEGSLYEYNDPDDIEEPEAEAQTIKREEPDAMSAKVNVASVPASAPATAPASTPTFCLNDRFRFRRAIFGGSDADFNEAMDRLATLETYDEAEEYFYGELGLNPEEEEVADFMRVIRSHYGL